MRRGSDAADQYWIRQYGLFRPGLIGHCEPRIGPHQADDPGGAGTGGCSLTPPIGRRTRAVVIMEYGPCDSCRPSSRRFGRPGPPGGQRPTKEEEERCERRGTLARALRPLRRRAAAQRWRQVLQRHPAPAPFFSVSATTRPPQPRRARRRALLTFIAPCSVLRGSDCPGTGSAGAQPTMPAADYYGTPSGPRAPGCSMPGRAPCCSTWRPSGAVAGAGRSRPDAVLVFLGPALVWQSSARRLRGPRRHPAGAQVESPAADRPTGSWPSCRPAMTILGRHRPGGCKTAAQVAQRHSAPRPGGRSLPS